MMKHHQSSSGGDALRQCRKNNPERITLPHHRDDNEQHDEKCKESKCKHKDKFDEVKDIGEHMFLLLSQPSALEQIEAVKATIDRKGRSHHISGFALRAPL